MTCQQLTRRKKKMASCLFDTKSTFGSPFFLVLSSAEYTETRTHVCYIACTCTLTRIPSQMCKCTHEHANGPLNARATDIHQVCMSRCTSQTLHSRAADTSTISYAHVYMSAPLQARHTYHHNFASTYIRVYTYTHTACKCTRRYE